METACCQHSFHVCFRLAVGPSNQARHCDIIQVSVEMQLVRCVCASKPHPGAQPAESEGQPWECSCNHGHASPADGRFSPPAPAHLLYELTEGLQSSEKSFFALCHAHSCNLRLTRWHPTRFQRRGVLRGLFRARSKSASHTTGTIPLLLCEKRGVMNIRLSVMSGLVSASNR